VSVEEHEDTLFFSEGDAHFRKPAMTVLEYPEITGCIIRVLQSFEKSWERSSN
jgi:hypothetical protein